MISCVSEGVRIQKMITFLFYFRSSISGSSFTDCGPVLQSDLTVLSGYRNLKQLWVKKR